MTNWFEVDRGGLAKLLERRGKAFAVFELISNGWDTNATKVTVDFKPVPGQAKATLIIEDDDPEGFADLAHAFTVFAESEKKDKVEKRGRYNLGEKLVLALCTEAIIASTTGTIVFDEKGRRKTSAKRATGSRFQGMLKMTHAEHAEALAAIQTLIPPPGVVTTVNGVALKARDPIASFEATLPTEVADADGNLKRSKRKTTVRVYEPLPGEVPALYELGIPVVETVDRWHVDIQQKVPLNMDRDNVPPSFLREVRTLVVNELHEHLTKADANDDWVRQATSNENIDEEAMKSVMDLRFGDKKVIYDPSDPEANKLAVSKGYTLIHGSMLSGTEWSNVKKSSAALPAGQVTPSPKPFSPDGDPLKLVHPKQYTIGMIRMVEYATGIAKKLMKKNITVQIANDITWPFNATYGDSGQLTFNLGRLGHDFFSDPIGPSQNRLLIHEFGHEYSCDHLSSEYHDALCRLGAEMTALALSDPEFFAEFE